MEEQQEQQDWDEIPVDQEETSDSGQKPEAIPDIKIPPSYRQGMNMLEYLLHDKNSVYTSKILAMMLEFKIKADDPIFFVLLSISELELLMVQLPQSLVTFGEEFFDNLEETFQAYFGEEADTQQRFETANQEYLAAVASGAEKIVDKISKRKFYGNVGAIARTITPAFLSLSLAFGLGVFGTLFVAKQNTRALVSAGELSVEQLQLLEWAQSKKGKKAKLIMDLNGDYLGNPCKKAAKDLGVKFTFGNRVVKDGFCLVLIENPS